MNYSKLNEHIIWRAYLLNKIHIYRRPRSSTFAPAKSSASRWLRSAASRQPPTTTAVTTPFSWSRRPRRSFTACTTRSRTTAITPMHPWSAMNSGLAVKLRNRIYCVKATTEVEIYENGSIRNDREPKRLTAPRGSRSVTTLSLVRNQAQPSIGLAHSEDQTQNRWTAALRQIYD